MSKKTVAAGIFIVRKDKQLLICHPTNHKADFWSIPKGKVDEGEKIFDAALRETYEETNLELKNNTNFSIHLLAPINYGHKKKILHPFVYLEAGNSKMDWDKEEIKCNSNVPVDRGGFPEMDDYLWCSLDEAEKLLHETQVACLPKIREVISDKGLTLVQ